MEAKAVLSTIRTAIKPSDIHIPQSCAAALVLLGTLGSSEYEHTAAKFVSCSKEANDSWLGFIYKDRTQAGSNFAGMIEAGFLVETEVAGGWQYELTHLAIEAIYCTQAEATFRRFEEQIRDLHQKVREAHGITFFDRMEKLFVPAPTTI